MFSFETKVRYSELSKNGLVRPEAIVNYLQDCTMFHSDMLGADVDFYKKEKKAWVLNSWQIDIHEDISAGQTLTIGTWPYDFIGAYGNRNFVIKNGDGKNIVEANTVWVFTDIEAGRPVKLTEDYTKFYSIEEKLPMEYLDRKIKIPKELAGFEKEPMHIYKSYIDSNGHVNNARYIECASEYLPKECRVKRIRAEYRNQAKYGSDFYPVVYKKEDDGIYVSLNDENGRVYAVIEFDIFM